MDENQREMLQHRVNNDNVDTQHLLQRKEIIKKRAVKIKKLERLYTLNLDNKKNHSNLNLHMKKPTKTVFFADGFVKNRLNNKLFNYKSQYIPKLNFLDDYGNYNESTEPTAQNEREIYPYVKNTKNFDKTLYENLYLKEKAMFIENNSNPQNIPKKKIPIRKSGSLKPDLGKTFLNKFNNNIRNVKSNRLGTFNSMKINFDKNNENIPFKKPRKSIKSINPLEIPDEDKIFDEMNQINDSDDKNKFNKTQPNFLKLSLEKSPTKKYKSYESKNNKILNELYKFTSEYKKKINNAIHKKNKLKLELKNYQSNIINNISENVSKNLVKRLQNKFLDLYEYALTDYSDDTNKRFLIQCENKEKEIIAEINNNTEDITQRIRTAANDNSTYQLNSELKQFYLPKLKFHRMVKLKKTNLFSVLFAKIKTNEDRIKNDERLSIFKIMKKYKKKDNLYLTEK
jgi:hypothetical protein